VRYSSVMSPLSIWLKAFRYCAGTINPVLFDLIELLRLATKSRTALVAENLFLRKQLAMFQERNIRPHRAQDPARWLMACSSRLFDWRDAFVVVKPNAVIRWHRRGKSYPKDFLKYFAAKTHLTPRRGYAGT